MDVEGEVERTEIPPRPGLTLGLLPSSAASLQENRKERSHPQIHSLFCQHHSTLKTNSHLALATQPTLPEPSPSLAGAF